MSEQYEFIFKECFALLHSDRDARPIADSLWRKYESTNPKPSLTPEWLYRETVEVLISTYRRSLFKYAVKCSGDVYVAEEAVQEASLKIFGRLRRFNARNGSSFLTWAISVVGNEVICIMRKRDWKIFRDAVLVEEHESCKVDVYAEREIISRILFKQLIKGLIPRDQEMILMKLDGIEDKKIASHFGMTEPATKKILHDLRILMRSMRNGDLPPRRRKNSYLVRGEI